MFRRPDRQHLTHSGLSLTPLTWRLARRSNPRSNPRYSGMPVEPAFHTGGWTAGWVDRRSNRLPQPPVYRRFRGPAVQPPVEPAVLPSVPRYRRLERRCMGACCNPDPRRPYACTCKLWAPQAINPNSDRRIQLRRHRNCYPASQRRGRIMHAAERQCN